MDIIIVTDLDGTLLDANDFTFDAIHKDIIELIENGIEFIPVSSKTRMEMMSFCLELGVITPFIYENGAGFSINAEGSS
ncbi:MAG: HAD hydrolase family protein, partial [Candidatus Puniceispirillaceae bacterium]